MSKFLELALVAVLMTGGAAAAAAGPLGLGRAALPEEVAAWDHDISPDGTGLPVGAGDVATGEPLFEAHCAACHGSFAEGVGNWPKLAGGEGTLADADPVKTVGSYWPYLSTVYDYVHRSMPFGQAQTLSDDEVYAIVAYILHSNDLVDEDFELSNETFGTVEMPNRDNFIVDDRPRTEYAGWRGEPCMQACKDAVRITMKATVLDVTPDHGGAAMAEAAPPDPVAPAAADAVDAALAAEGEKVFRKCKACHQVGEGAGNRTGPALNGIVGRDIGAVEGFRYSKPMEAMNGVWDSDRLHAFLAAPKSYVKGTRMSFAGLKAPGDIDAVVEYLRTFD